MKLLKKLSFKKIVSILVFVSIFILLINSYVIYYITKEQKKQNKVINVAGRQRMLTQKITKSALLAVYDNYSKEKLLTTINKFNDNLEDLKYGNPERDLPPTENETIKEQQTKVTNIWNKFKKKVKIVMDEKATMSDKEEAINYIRNNNIKLLEEVNKAVKLYEENSIQNIVLSIQAVIFIIGVLIIFITWLIVNSIINKSELDQLTNIYNREKISREMKRKIMGAKRYRTELGLIMFDIDNFKEVNDNFGHDTGDKVLIKITDIVGMTIRTTDIFARWGGDEFMILVPNTDLDSTIKLAERLRRKIAQYEFEDVGRVTCSFGVTELKQDNNFNIFTKRVDNALYKAKEKGRNQVVNM